MGGWWCWGVGNQDAKIGCWECNGDQWTRCPAAKVSDCAVHHPPTPPSPSALSLSRDGVKGERSSNPVCPRNIRYPWDHGDLEATFSAELVQVCGAEWSYPLVIPPPPLGGHRHLAQQAWETLRTEGAEENLSLGYTGTGVGGGRHLETPPPQWGGASLTIGGGITRGGGGYKWN